jgi:HK97 gp10 family phage protein
MANVSIEIKNGERIIGAFKKSPLIMAKGLQDAVLKIGVFTAGEVKKVITQGEDMFKSPVDTGAMRRGIQMSQTGKLKAIIRPSRLTPYALFVHEGTRFMRARPFFQITADRHKDAISKFFLKELETIVKAINRT